MTENIYTVDNEDEERINTQTKNAEMLFVRGMPNPI